VLALRIAGWALSFAALAVNAYALFALFSTRRADASILGRHARRCLVSALVVGLSVGLFAAAALLTRPETNSSADRARFLASTIAEGVNTLGFGLLASLLPVIAGWVLRSRARRA